MHTTVYKMKEYPQYARPRERMEMLGAEQLSDQELLAILLATGSRHSLQLYPHLTPIQYGAWLLPPVLSAKLVLVSFLLVQEKDFLFLRQSINVRADWKGLPNHTNLIDWFYKCRQEIKRETKNKNVVVCSVAKTKRELTIYVNMWYNFKRSVLW